MWILLVISQGEIVFSSTLSIPSWEIQFCDSIYCHYDNKLHFFFCSSFFSGFRKFPIGVVKYLTWPSTTWSKKVTCTHHLWTIPLVLYACSGLHWMSFPLSISIVITNVCLSRWLTPFVLNMNKHDKEEGMQCKYMNVNLSHELWKDIKFSFLQISYDNPSTFIYLFRLIWKWQVLNMLIFLFVLLPFSQAMFGSDFQL